MRQHVYTSFVTALLVLTVAACGGEPEPTPRPLPTMAPAGVLTEPEEDASPTADAEAGTSEDAERPEAGGEPTEAEATEPADLADLVEPAFTAGPSPTPHPSVTPGPLPAGLPTSDPEGWPAGNLSPDGRWWVRGIVGEEVEVEDERWYYRGQQVVSTDGSEVHTVIDEWSRSGLGAPEPAVLGWTPDSRWVYLYETGTADGCGLYPWGQDLRRLDPATGEIQYLEAWMPGAPALSPDGLTVAFVSPPRVVLVQPDNGSFLEALLPGAERGDVRAGELRYDDQGRLEMTVDQQACSAEWTRAPARLDPMTGQIELLATPAPATPALAPVP